MSTFGEELRRERELREISLRDVAEATKIGLRHLEAMERNDFAHLPGGVINRGFVRAYCQFIGVDAEAMVNAYLLEEQVQTGGDGGSESGLLRRRAGRSKPRAERKTGGKALFWALAVLVAAGLLAGAYLYIKFSGEGGERPAAAPGTGERDRGRPAAQAPAVLAAAAPCRGETVG